MNICKNSTTARVGGGVTPPERERIRLGMDVNSKPPAAVRELMGFMASRISPDWDNRRNGQRFQRSLGVPRETPSGSTPWR